MAADYDISVLSPASDWELFLSDGLNEHIGSLIAEAGFRPLAVKAKQGDTICGGIFAYLNWNWVQVSLVWVHPEHRGNGLGSKLIDALEARARSEGCKFAHLDTFSFQARPFYERFGYEVFAELSEYPPGHSRYFMKKTL